MQTAEMLYEARWIVPVEPTGVVLAEHALVVDGERIVALLPRAEARARHPSAERVSLPEHVLLPGLVNAHVHAAMTLLRGHGSGLALHDWLRRSIWPAEQACVGPEFVRDGTRLAVAEMIRGGTTCFADQYFFPEQAAAVVAEAGLRACLGLVVIDFATAWAAGADECLQRGLAARDQWKHEPLLAWAFAPHAPYSVGDAALERVRGLADELELPLHMHVHESAREVDEAGAERPLARLHRLGLLSAGFSAVHFTQVDDADIGRLVESGAGVVHCPQSNLKLASGWCPVARLLDAGINVAIGTDGAASNDDLDAFDEMRSAALLANAVAGDAAAVDAHRVLRMATLDGARALGLVERIGSLEPGKSADFIAVDLAHAATTPVYDPVVSLVYAASRAQVSDAWVAGRALLRGGRLLTVDEAVARERARDWAARVSALPAGAVA